MFKHWKMHSFFRFNCLKHWTSKLCRTVDETLLTKHWKQTSRSFNKHKKKQQIFFSHSFLTKQFTPWIIFIIFVLTQHQKEIKALKFYFRRQIYFVSTRRKVLLFIPQASKHFFSFHDPISNETKSNLRFIQLNQQRGRSTNR